MGDKPIMSNIIKNDWKGKGKFKAIADWMNAVANQFNFANVPSGGTAQPTSTGFQIEVDSADDEEYQFKVTAGETIETPASISVDVAAGWWAYYYSYTESAEEDAPVFTGRVQVDFLDTNLIVTETSFVILKIDVADNKLIVISSTTVASSEPNIYYKKLATVTVADGAIVDIDQHWKGGNILSTLSLAESEDANGGNGGEDGEAPTDECDQNTHPGEDGEGEEDEYPPEEGGGGGGGGEEDPPTGHPSDPDCYSTIPDPIP
jgi:hypothetical protein